MSQGNKRARSSTGQPIVSVYDKLDTCEDDLKDLSASNLRVVGELENKKRQVETQEASHMLSMKTILEGVEQLKVIIIQKTGLINDVISRNSELEQDILSLTGKLEECISRGTPPPVPSVPTPSVPTPSVRVPPPIPDSGYSCKNPYYRSRNPSKFVRKFSCPLTTGEGPYTDIVRKGKDGKDGRFLNFQGCVSTCYMDE